MKKYIYILVFAFSINHLSAQNLVQNSSFENHYACTADAYYMDNVVYWNCFWSVDYFNVNRSRYSFANGTPLEVDLDITQVYDNSINVYKNKSYSMVKFHKIIDLPEQKNLDLFGSEN